MQSILVLFVMKNMIIKTADINNRKLKCVFLSSFFTIVAFLQIHLKYGSFLNQVLVTSALQKYLISQPKHMLCLLKKNSLNEAGFLSTQNIS